MQTMPPDDSTPLRRLTPQELRALRSQSFGHDVPREPAPPLPRRQPVRRYGRWIIGFSLSLLLVSVLAYLAPLAWASWRAYQRVFVTPLPRATVVINAQGTPELVLVTPDDRSVQLPDWDAKDRINILLLGVDRREAEEVPRSDTIIIVTIDPLTKDVGMLSIPRDLLVTIPGYGDDKINAAYALGASSPITGPGLVRATIEYNFGIPIHYYAEVDFEGFVRIVDTLGGVVVDVPAPIKDDEYPGEDYNYTRVYFAPGLQHMDGRTALRYVRTRHDDSDFARGYRQQQVLRALRDQGLRLDLIRKAPTLVNQLADAVRTDLTPTQVLALAKLGTEIPRERIRSFTLLPATEDYWQPGQPYYLLPNWPAIQAILDEMFPPREGQPRPQVRRTAVNVPTQPVVPEPAPQEPPPEIESTPVEVPESSPTPELTETPIVTPEPTVPPTATPEPVETPTVPKAEPSPTPHVPSEQPTPTTPVTPVAHG